MLRRFADARLRRVLAREVRAKKRYRDLARERRDQLAARDHQIGTLGSLLATYQGIARKALADLAAERARNKETT